MTKRYADPDLVEMIPPWDKPCPACKSEAGRLCGRKPRGLGGVYIFRAACEERRAQVES